MLTLNQMLPGPAKHVEAATAYAHPAPPEGHLRANFVASVDGAAALDEDLTVPETDPHVAGELLQGR